MKCSKPFRKGLGEFGCGQCLPCRINRQRLWTIRGVLEAGEHAYSSYVTLTLDERFSGEGCVSVYAAQLFLKRLRERHGPFRYLICGEYGEKTWRPHYHAILFGVRDGHYVAEAWGQGGVYISGVGPESIAYVVGYCLKGAYNASGMRYHGKGERCPEFLRMSKKPGLGAKAAERIGAFFTTKPGAAVLARDGGVPTVVRQGVAKWPLGRYLRGKVKSVAGIDVDSESRIRQVNEALQLQGLDQVDLNELLSVREGVSERSGLGAEQKVKRQRLEKRL